MNRHQPLHDGITPAWVPSPPKRTQYNLVVIYWPLEDTQWQIAMSHEIEAIGEDDSLLGKALRRDAALLCLTYCANN